MMCIHKPYHIPSSQNSTCHDTIVAYLNFPGTYPQIPTSPGLTPPIYTTNNAKTAKLTAVANAETCKTEYDIMYWRTRSSRRSMKERTMAQRKYSVMSVEDYLLLNRNSKDTRYEYLDGELRMLAGGSPDHSIIIANLTATIKGLLKGGPYRIYNSDVQLKLSEKRYVFPDITVSCDERDRNQKETVRYPRVVVEVLSPTTEATDRGKKAAHYRACPTIHEYMMVDSEEALVEVHRREEARWTINTFEPGDTITLASLGIQFPIEDAYEGTSLTYEPELDRNRNQRYGSIQS